MADQAVRVERSGPVTTVLLHRPARRNAVDGPAAAELAAAFRAFDADPDAAAAVLHGEGGVFCSGADLTAIGTERGNRVSPDGDGPMGVSRLRLSKPVIAAVAGYAVAGGLELALWCDLRVADETAVFGVFCRRWGVPLIDGGTVRLPRLIGTSRAMDMILTGRAVDAAEAAAIGLANRVVPPGQALAAAQELAAKLAAFPQVCLRGDRASVLDAEGLDETAAMASEFAHGQAALASETGARRGPVHGRRGPARILRGQSGLVKVLLAVNGGLMRGLKLSGHLTEVNASFVADARTAPEYRMWSINDDYPAMLRVRDNSGRSIAVEIWSVTPESLVKVFFGEPHGLSLGWVVLADGTKTIGVLAEADLVEGQREITGYGGWRAYTEAEGIPG